MKTKKPKLTKNGKRMGRPPGSKTKVKRIPKPVITHTSAELEVALNNIRHWRKEATRLAEQLIVESLTE